MSIDKLRESIKEYDDIYIYGFGIAGRWLSDNLSKKINNFIDTDENKSGRAYNNI